MNLSTFRCCSSVSFLYMLYSFRILWQLNKPLTPNVKAPLSISSPLDGPRLDYQLSTDCSRIAHCHENKILLWDFGKWNRSIVIILCKSNHLSASRETCDVTDIMFSNFDASRTSSFSTVPAGGMHDHDKHPENRVGVIYFGVTYSRSQNAFFVLMSFKS